MAQRPSVRPRPAARPSLVELLSLSVASWLVVLVGVDMGVVGLVEDGVTHIVEGSREVEDMDEGDDEGEEDKEDEEDGEDGEEEDNEGEEDG